MHSAATTIAVASVNDDNINNINKKHDHDDDDNSNINNRLFLKLPLQKCCRVT